MKAIKYIINIALNPYVSIFICLLGGVISGLTGNVSSAILWIALLIQLHTQLLMELNAGKRDEIIDLLEENIQGLERLLKHERL